MTNIIEKMYKEYKAYKYCCIYCQYSEDIMTSRGSTDAFEYEFPVERIVKPYKEKEKFLKFTVDDWNNFIQKHGEEVRGIGKVLYLPKFGNISKVYIKYPPFTAEKQIELIKIIAESSNLILGKRSHGDFEYYFGDSYGHDVVHNVNFADGLAEEIIQLKSYLDNSKVKEILEK